MVGLPGFQSAFTAAPGQFEIQAQTDTPFTVAGPGVFGALGFAVPEPNSGFLLIGALALLFGHLRRRTHVVRRARASLKQPLASD